MTRLQTVVGKCWRFIKPLSENKVFNMEGLEWILEYYIVTKKSITKHWISTNKLSTSTRSQPGKILLITHSLWVTLGLLIKS